MKWIIVKDLNEHTYLLNLDSIDYIEVRSNQRNDIASINKIVDYWIKINSRNDEYRTIYLSQKEYDKLIDVMGL